MIKKTVIINRAVPGSGKTTITNCIVDELQKNNITVSVHSTDEYFMVGNKYEFEIEKLGEYHNRNFNSFKKSILNNIDVVICDNTNIAPWQTESYTKLAREHKYQIVFITLNPRELEKHIESQQVTPAKPNAHGVKEDILRMMIDDYYSNDDLLNQDTLINYNKHIKYKWNSQLNKKIPIGITKHFDSDSVIRILPNEYQIFQKRIGTDILKLVNSNNDNLTKTNQVKSSLVKNTKEDYTALHMAIMHDDINEIKQLLKSNENIEIKCRNDLSPLEFALFKENFEIIKEFYYFYPNKVKKYLLDNLALHLACYLEDLECVTAIIAKNVNINMQNDQGNTPLYIAMNSNNIHIVEFLVEKEADLYLENFNGDSPIIIGFKNNRLDKNPIVMKYAKKQLEKYNSFLNLISENSNHNAHDLIEILKNFTLENPIKYSVHIWDFGNFKNKYLSFDGYMTALKEEFNKTSWQLKELSPNLYKKIYTFLFETSPNSDYSWCNKLDINIGWSSLGGIEEWCNNGKNPFNFKLKDSFILENKEINTFGEVINLFKQEIEIRSEFKNLTKIFKQQKKQLDSQFIMEVAKLDKQFYTDTQKFKSTLDKIFSEIKKRDDYKKIEVNTSEPEEGIIKLQITHINSYPSKNKDELLSEIEDGDFLDIKRLLTNLCDWSIESSCEDENFRINYLKSKKTKDIEVLDYKPKGFSYIMKFYK